MQYDPLNDAFVTIKNAQERGKLQCVIKPSSKLIGRTLRVMEEHDYINQFEYVEDGKGGVYKVHLNGHINSCGVIKPRRSVKRAELGKFEARYLPAQDFGVLIISTNKGVITHTQARELGIGGRLIGYVY